jgi:hypothetical protein
MTRPEAYPADMTVLDQVRTFVTRQEPRAVCDDCIAEKLHLSVRQHANHKTRVLELEREFDRRVDSCGICGKTKKVIRRR